MTPYDLALTPYELTLTPYDSALTPYEFTLTPYDLAPTPYELNISPYDLTPILKKCVSNLQFISKMLILIDGGFKLKHSIRRNPSASK